MKSITKLTKEDIEQIRLIVLDVDGVLVPRGTIIEQSGNRTVFETKQIAKEEIDLIRELSKCYHINISSGRALYMLMDMFREVLPFVSITYENGSATWMNGQVFQHSNTFAKMRNVREELSVIKDKRIKGWEPKEFIITIHSTDRINEIEEVASKYGGLYCMWNGEAYDIGVKEEQTKGVGLCSVIEMLKIKKENVLAIGDNLNDIELLEEAGLKISADKTKVSGDFYIPFPAELLMRKLSEAI